MSKVPHPARDGGGIKPGSQGPAALHTWIRGSNSFPSHINTTESRSGQLNFHKGQRWAVYPAYSGWYLVTFLRQRLCKSRQKGVLSLQVGVAIKRMALCQADLVLFQPSQLSPVGPGEVIKIPWTQLPHL